MISAFATWAAGTAASIGTSTIMGSASGPLGRAMDFVGNNIAPNAVAAWDALHRAWSVGFINWKELQVNARSQGIALGADVAPEGLQIIAETWEKVAIASLPRPDQMAVFHGMVRQIFTPADEAWLRSKYAFPQEIMQHTQDLFRDQWNTSEVMQLANREYISGQKVIDCYLKAGGYLEETMKGYEELRKVIPGVGDLIRFTIKEAFNPEMVERLQLYAEIEDADLARNWAERQGLGNSTLYVEGVPVETTNWFNAYWATHWQLPGTGQLAEMRNRLRPERMYRYEKQVPGITAFTDEDYDVYMKANDYTPNVRKWLEATALAQPRLIDIRNEYFEGIIDRNEFVQLQLDRGYTEVDAEVYAKLADKQKDRYTYKHRAREMDRYDARLYDEVINAYRVGSISESQLTATLIGILQSADAANSVVAAERIRKNNQIITQTISMVKRAFFTGEMRSSQAVGILESEGIEPNEVSRLVHLWELNFDMPRRQVSAQKLIGWVVTGTMPMAVLQQRLIILGYSERDVANMLAETQIKRMNFLEKQSEAKRKEDKKKGSGKAKDGEKWRTPPQIVKWLGQGLVSHDEAVDLLKSIDTPEDDINLWLSGAKTQ